MNLEALPAFSDNYIWLLHDGAQAVVVDPGDSEPVHAALDANGLELAGILVTHHHGDHTGGVADLRRRLRPGAQVYGPLRERMPEPCVRVAGGATIALAGLTFDVIDTPGHTAGHVSFFARPDGAAPLLFCGDTLFSAGCGRLFEGTPAQMHASLERLAALPGDTRVCCAHEYTVSNLKFAAAVEPGNADVVSHRLACEALRAAGRPTLPSTVALERRINPFLRVSEPEVVAAARAQGATSTAPVDVLAAIRDWKNRF